MPILNKQIVLSSEEKKTRLMEAIPRRVESLAKALFNDFCQKQRESLAVLWENQGGATPQEVCDALGTDAASVFNLHGKLTSSILEMAAMEGVKAPISLPKKVFTINADGTVTIEEEDYPITPELVALVKFD